MQDRTRPGTSAIHAIVVVAIAATLAACGSASPTPSASPIFSVAPSVSASFGIVDPTVTPEPATATPELPTASPPDDEPSGTLPIHGSARELSAHSVQLAAAADGSLYVSIPDRDGPVVLARLGRDGKPMPGWPVAIRTATWCDRPFPTSDSGVRIVCNATDLPRPEIDGPDVRGFAFDAGGHVMDGWPVRLRPGPSGYDPELGLTLLEFQSLTDTVDASTISREARVTTVDDAGAVHRGTPVGMVESFSNDAWTVGSKATASGSRGSDEATTPILMVGRDGTFPGWPLDVAGRASQPAFRADGQIAMAVSSATGKTSRVVLLDRAGHARSSAPFGLVTTEPDAFEDTGGCTVQTPPAPVLAPDGSVFVYSQLTTPIFALDASLNVRSGWPFRPSAVIQVPTPGKDEEHEAGYCPALAPPAAGPDGTLYVPLVPGSSSAGGSLVAVGTNGRIRSGWPVTLKRSGGEFWAVTTGSDGTVYALAVEPESRGRSSATILAIEPDSTIRYATTIVEP